jgi:opacity protein-like surface antigen
MRKLGLLVAVLLVLGIALPSRAQEEDKFSVYGGYYYVHSNISVSGETTDDASIVPQAVRENENFGFNFNGGGGQFAYNFNQDQKMKYGLVAEFTGVTSSNNGVTSNVFTYLFGPRISFGNGKLVPFGEVLVGGARISGAFINGGNSQNGFALSAGGGLDYQLTKHWFVRPIQASYLLTRFSVFGSNQSQNSFQYSAGVGYRWP